MLQHEWHNLCADELPEKIASWEGASSIVSAGNKHFRRPDKVERDPERTTASWHQGQKSLHFVVRSGAATAIEIFAQPPGRDVPYLGMNYYGGSSNCFAVVRALRSLLHEGRHLPPLSPQHPIIQCVYDIRGKLRDVNFTIWVHDQSLTPPLQQLTTTLSLEEKEPTFGLRSSPGKFQIAAVTTHIADQVLLELYAKKDTLESEKLVSTIAHLTLTQESIHEMIAYALFENAGEDFPNLVANPPRRQTSEISSGHVSRHRFLINAWLSKVILAIKSLSKFLHSSVKITD